MSWSKPLDIIGYIVVLACIGTGIAHIVDPSLSAASSTTDIANPTEAEGYGASFYFIIAFFIAMFIFMAKQNRKLHDNFNHNDK